MTRDEAVQVIVKTPFWERFTEEEREAISMAIESLSIEVVRCEDCRYWDNRFDVMVCNLTDGMKGASDFCSYGERRE